MRSIALLFTLLAGLSAIIDPDSLKSASSLLDNLLNSTKGLLADVDAQACLISLKAEFTNIDFVTRTLLKCGMNASSPECEHINVILNDRGLRLIDSWPKLQPGFLTKGPFFFLGDYDECAALGSDTTAPVTPLYDYCRAHLSIEVGNQSVPAVAGICLPRDCGDYLRRNPSFSGLPAWLDASGWAAHVHFAAGPTGAGWRCAAVGEEAERRSGIASGAVIAVAVALTTLVICGTALDRWKRREKHDNEDYDKLSGSSERSCSSLSLATTLSTRSDASSQAEFTAPAPSIALTYRDGREIRRRLARVGVLTEMLCSFSIRSSLAHLFRNAEKDIKCLHALRILAAVWVVVGHSCLFSLFYIDNARLLKESISSPTLSSYFLLASPLAVDTFLFISGAVMSFSYRKRLLFGQGLPQATLVRRVTRWILFIVHRIFRVYPTILLVCLFTLFVFNSLGDGPMWDPEIGVFGTNCTTLGDVAPHLFFVGNFAPSFCLPWLWHLSLDMQIQIFCPLLLIGLTHTPIRARIAAAVLTVLIIVYRVVSVHAFGIYGDVVDALLAESAFPQSEQLETMFVWFYGNPLSRAAPFLIGALTGWQVCLRSERTPCWKLLAGLKVTAAVLLLAAFITPGSDSFYHSVHLIGSPTAWSAGLALLVWLCENGHCPSLQSLLGSHRMLPFSRLAFGVYITHEQLLLLMIFTGRRPATPTSLGHFLLLAVTTFSLSLLISFLLAVSIEIPPQTLEKRLLKKRKRPCERRPRRPFEELEPLAPAVSAQNKAALWVSSDHGGHAKWAKCRRNVSFLAKLHQDEDVLQSVDFPSDSVVVEPSAPIVEENALQQQEFIVDDVNREETKEVDDSVC